MNFDQDYKEFLEWEKTKCGTIAPTEFTAEEDVSIRLFVAYLNCRYAAAHLTNTMRSDGKGRCISSSASDAEGQCENHNWWNTNREFNFCPDCGRKFPHQ